VAKGLLLQRLVAQNASPRRGPRPNRLTAWAFPPTAAYPKKRRNPLSRPTNPDTPTVWPACRLDRLANLDKSSSHPEGQTRKPSRLTGPFHLKVSTRGLPQKDFTIPVPLSAMVPPEGFT